MTAWEWITGKSKEGPPLPKIAIIFDNIGPPVSSEDIQFFENSPDYRFIGVVVGNSEIYIQYQWHPP